MVDRSVVRRVDDFCGWEVPNGATPSVTPDDDDDNKLRQIFDRIRGTEFTQTELRHDSLEYGKIEIIVAGPPKPQIL